MTLAQPRRARRHVGLNWGLYAQIDASRQWQGQLLDALGLGPVKTPSRVVLQTSALTLKAYDAPDRSRPALLVVPAPIKRSYIWDLLPRASVIQRCREHGLPVYLAHWERPGEVERDYGLAEYADSLIVNCMDAIRKETGHEHIFIAGHSLGGTLAAIFAALHPRMLQGLVLLGAPLHFALDASAFARILAVLMRSPH